MEDQNKINFIKTTKTVIVVLVSAYFVYYSLTAKDWHFIDNINLIIHEAGHPIFMFFGQFIGVLGGSFFQILVPVIFVFYFYKQMKFFSASLLLFWVGQNFINVSVYASDAISMDLPLLGGDSSIHDWNYILTDLGILKYTKFISSSLYAIGFAIIILVTYFSLTYLSEKENVETIY